MQRIALTALVLCLLPLAGSRTADAHCEVPCGIYADQARFERMIEDAATIKRAQGQMAQLAGKTDAQSVNQMVRWVKTKEEHATNTQHVIAQYFMTQRIKPTQKTYVERLKSSHAVMVAAMKCKQSADTSTAEALKAAIIAFHKIYEPNAGKKKDGDKGGHGHGHGHDHDK